jgi:hypothetical protein
MLSVRLPNDRKCANPKDNKMNYLSPAIRLRAPWLKSVTFRVPMRRVIDGRRHMGELSTDDAVPSG